MNTFNKQQIDYVLLVTDVAYAMGIDNLIFDCEKGHVRGINDRKTVVILSPFPDDFEFDFRMMGMYRLKTFKDRCKLVDLDKCTISYELDTNNDVSQINLDYDDLYIEYRCASPSVIKAPKAINDEFTIAFNISMDNIAKAKRVLTAMAGSINAPDRVMSITTKDEGISFLALDDVHDACEFKVTDEFESIDGDRSFIFKYPATLLMTFLDFDRSTNIRGVALSKRGILTSNVKDIDVYILPKV